LGIVATSPPIAFLLTVGQIAGRDDTNQGPGLAEKHDEEEAPLVGVAIGQVVAVARAEKQGLMRQDSFSFVPKASSYRC
jgi:hypothetical protein